jgi:hypothetical protein
MRVNILQHSLRVCYVWHNCPLYLYPVSSWSLVSLPKNGSVGNIGHSTYAHVHSCARTRARTHARTHTHAHTHTRAHANTNKHTGDTWTGCILSSFYENNSKTFILPLVIYSPSLHATLPECDARNSLLRLTATLYVSYSSKFHHVGSTWGPLLYQTSPPLGNFFHYQAAKSQNRRHLRQVPKN